MNTQLTAISQRTQFLFKSTNTVAHLQSQIDNLLAAVETLTTGTLTLYLIPHTTLHAILDQVSQTLRTTATHFTLFTNTPYIIIPTLILYIGYSILMFS